MSKMVPNSIDPNVKSNAERRIFEWFSNLDWKNSVVLHSLGIANHNKNIFGEIDFVFISNEGILCIEVKGGRVGRENGVWTFTNRFNEVATKHKGPFEQAQENMHSLRRHLKKRLRSNDRIISCQYASAVMTPDSIINVNGPEMNDEILFDANYNEQDLKMFIKQAYNYWRQTCLEKHRFEGERLSNNDINRVVNLLRGDFQLSIPLATIVSRTEETLLSLTDEQFLIMQGFDNNRRMLISGPAGTGKTVLAIEQCIRAASERKKVLYLCYNKLIAINVKRTLKIRNIEDVDVYTLHSLLLKVCNMTHDEQDNEFYISSLPELFLHLIEDNELFNFEPYDKVVIDEGQDLMKANYYLCINELVKGNLSNGEWTIYFDQNQNIFGNLEEFGDIWEELQNDASNFRLTINCRNTQQISAGNEMMTNIWQAKLVKAEGMGIQYYGYSSLNKEYKLIIKCLRNLKAQGVSMKDIVLLSPYLPNNRKCCLCSAIIPEDLGSLLVNDSFLTYKNSSVRFYTIQSFKGLEAKVILLIDVDEFESEPRRLLNYVGISRARSLLYVFYDQRVEQQRQNMLVNSFLNKSNAG